MPSAVPDTAPSAGARHRARRTRHYGVRHRAPTGGARHRAGRTRHYGVRHRAPASARHHALGGARHRAQRARHYGVRHRAPTGGARHLYRGLVSDTMPRDEVLALPLLNPGTLAPRHPQGQQ
jgi:hypothetical protein